MLFAILCNDKPGHLQLRLDTRPAHLDYLNWLGETLKFAGPFLDEDGKPNGSLLVFEAATRQAAEKIAAGAPYAKAGLFEEVTVRQWNWAIKSRRYVSSDRSRAGRLPSSTSGSTRRPAALPHPSAAVWTLTTPPWQSRLHRLNIPNTSRPRGTPPCPSTPLTTSSQKSRSPRSTRWRGITGTKRPGRKSFR